MTPAVLTRLLAAAGDAVLATRLVDGRQLVWPEDPLPAEIDAAARRALDADTSMAATAADGAPWFLHLHRRPPRLLLVGAVNIAQSLCVLACPLGLAPVVIDPRQALLTVERFPGAERVDGWPDAEVLGLDARAALVVLSHDPKIDDPALDAALRSPAFYIGALGSRRTQAARAERMRALGHGEAALARIRGPVGLPIGALGPAEIALSILAEIVAVRRAAPLGTRAG